METIAYSLALFHIDGIGPVRYRQLVEHFGSPRAVFDHREDAAALLGESFRAALFAPPWTLVDSDLAWAKQPQHAILALDSPGYPARLRQISDAPPVLFVHGQSARLSANQIAIVGSRNPTLSGKTNATQFARDLSGRGITVTSGLAMGVDGAAHSGALEGSGNTIAVLGTGVDTIYPRSHQNLAAQIVDSGGALVSEFARGTTSKRENFPRRNRIISGLSAGTLVVEAARQSGSLITARFAAEQGREVFAIPGSIHNPLSRGCHDLIKQGAKLVETIDDILQELPSLQSDAINLTFGSPIVSAHDKKETSSVKHPILERIGFEPVHVDAISNDAGLTAAETTSMLLVLELQGHVKRMAGGLYCRVTNERVLP